MNYIKGTTPLDRSIAAKRVYVALVESCGSADWTNIKWQSKLDEVDKWARKGKPGSILEIGSTVNGLHISVGLLVMASLDSKR